MISRNFKMVLFSTTLIFTTQLDAHVTLEYPAGGESFSVGQLVNIQWRIDIPHTQENWDLYYSVDDGSKWTALAEDLPVSQLSYQWLVPSVATNLAKIKIVMDNTGTDYEYSSGSFSIHGSTVGVDDENGRPADFELLQNYPNPFNPSTLITYDVPAASHVSLSIYDLRGDELASFEADHSSAGRYTFQWSAKDKRGESLDAGVYFARLQSGDYSQTIKMLYSK